MIVIVVVVIGEVGETNGVIKIKLPVDVFFVHCCDLSNRPGTCSTIEQHTYIYFFFSDYYH